MKTTLTAGAPAWSSKSRHRRGVRRLLRALFPALLLSALGAATLAVAEDGRWATYTNARFGTTADYPAHLFTVRDRAPENSDGQSFRTTDQRAQLLIYGARNAQNDTPQSYLDSYVDLKDAVVAYRQVTARFYAVSGMRGDRIFYDRCNFPSVRLGVIDCIRLIYPVSEKAQWDPIAARISASLRAGQGIEPRR